MTSLWSSIQFCTESRKSLICGEVLSWLLSGLTIQIKTGYTTTGQFLSVYTAQEKIGRNSFPHPARFPFLFIYCKNFQKNCNLSKNLQTEQHLSCIEKKFYRSMYPFSSLIDTILERYAKDRILSSQRLASNIFKIQTCRLSLRVFQTPEHWAFARWWRNELNVALQLTSKSFIEVVH